MHWTSKQHKPDNLPTRVFSLQALILRSAMLRNHIHVKVRLPFFWTTGNLEPRETQWPDKRIACSVSESAPWRRSGRRNVTCTRNGLSRFFAELTKASTLENPDLTLYIEAPSYTLHAFSLACAVCGVFGCIATLKQVVSNFQGRKWIQRKWQPAICLFFLVQKLKLLTVLHMWLQFPQDWKLYSEFVAVIENVFHPRRCRNGIKKLSSQQVPVQLGVNITTLATFPDSLLSCSRWTCEYRLLVQSHNVCVKNRTGRNAIFDVRKNLQQHVWTSWHILRTCSVMLQWVFAWDFSQWQSAGFFPGINCRPTRTERKKIHNLKRKISKCKKRNSCIWWLYNASDHLDAWHGKCFFRRHLFLPKSKRSADCECHLSQWSVDSSNHSLPEKINGKLYRLLVFGESLMGSGLGEPLPLKRTGGITHTQELVLTNFIYDFHIQQITEQVRIKKVSFNQQCIVSSGLRKHADDWRDNILHENPGPYSTMEGRTKFSLLVHTWKETKNPFPCPDRKTTLVPSISVSVHPFPKSSKMTSSKTMQKTTIEKFVQKYLNIKHHPKKPSPKWKCCLVYSFMSAIQSMWPCDFCVFCGSSIQRFLQNDIEAERLELKSFSFVKFALELHPSRGKCQKMFMQSNTESEMSEDTAGKPSFLWHNTNGKPLFWSRKVASIVCFHQKRIERKEWD